MKMEEATAALEADGRQGEERAHVGAHTRIDWRTGREVHVRGAAFWKEHVARRIEQGLSVAAYCEANGLAKATFRRYASATKAGSQGIDARTQTPAQPSRFVPVGGSPAAVAEAMVVEIEAGDGMKLRLGGAAADRLVQHVLARLA
jgi:hypothetical protein